MELCRRAVNSLRVLDQLCLCTTTSLVAGETWLKWRVTINKPKTSEHPTAHALRLEAGFDDIKRQCDDSRCCTTDTPTHEIPAHPQLSVTLSNQELHAIVDRNHNSCEGYV